MTEKAFEVVDMFNYLSGKIIEICKFGPDIYRIRDYGSSKWWTNSRTGDSFSTIAAARRRVNKAIDKG